MNSFFLKRVLLALSILSSLTATFAMEMPEDEKGKQKIVQKMSEVAEDEQCGVCYVDAKTLGESKLQATNCPCDKFICSNCVDRIKAEADGNAALTPEQRDTFANANHFDPINLSKAKCPFCRKPLTVRPIKLKKDYSQQKPITIIDRDGSKIVLSGQESAALLKCVTIANMIDEVGDYTIDLSWLAEAPDFSVMKQLIACCNDIKAASKDLNAADDIALFKFANYLDAPANIIHFFANRIWVCIQDAAGDTPEMKAEKKRLRLLAEPYLANPGHVIAYAQYHSIDLRNTIKQGTYWAGVHFAGGLIDISYATLVPLLTEGDGWYKADDGLWYNATFKFGSLKNVKKIVEPIHSGATISINASGHALTQCHLKEIMSAFYTIQELILNDNLIQVLDVDTTGHIDLEKLTIRNNPIATIDDSFYNLVYQKRIRCFPFSLTLKSNALTEEQKQEVQDKFYRITHTIPERFMNLNTTRALLFWTAMGAVPFGSVGGAVMGIMLASNVMPMSGSIAIECLKVAVGMVGGATGVPASFLITLRALWKALRVITSVSHPEINKSFYGWQLVDSIIHEDRDPLPFIYAGDHFKISIE
jgi:hypothetical protein